MKITLNRKTNGIKVYTLWQNGKPLAESSSYNKITRYKNKKLNN